LRDLVDFAHSLADASGAAIRPYFRAAIDVADKGADGFFDPVTAADEAAERIAGLKKQAMAETWAGPCGAR